MKLISKNQNVKAYALKEGNLFWNSYNEVYNYDGEVIFKSETSLQNIKFDQPFLFISDTVSDSIIIGKQNIRLEGVFVHARYTEESLFVYKEGSTKLLNLKDGVSFHDFLDDRIFTFLRHDNFLFYKKDKTKIFCCTVPDARAIWQYNLADLGTYTPLYKQEEKHFEVGKFLGVWQNDLLIACDGGLLLALNQESGVLTRQWQGLPKGADDYLQSVFRGQLPQQGYIYQLNQAQTHIEAFFLHYYFYIDLESGTMHLINCKDNLKKYQIEQFKYSSAYAEDETHLYTKVTYDKGTLGTDYIPTGLCAFNKQTHEIDWQYRFDQHDDYLKTDNPQLSDNKLYQLSADKVLYIFEKEVDA